MTEIPPYDCAIEGYAWIPRMLWKARATLAGTPGNYLFGCPVDHTCMARLGIAPELVLDLAARYPDDADALAALREHGIPPAEEAWFDGQQVEDEVQETYLRVRKVDALEDGVFAGADHGAAVTVEFLDADQPWHAHDDAEVVAVVDGSATFFLGEQQARIVRAREIVRIPAGISHRCLAHDGFRAVAARPA